MNIKEIAFETEELQIQAEKISSLSAALYSAIYSGGFSADSYEWAFVLLRELTCALAKQLDKETEELFKIIKAEKECA